MNQSFTAETRLLMRHAIAAAGGNEVFFLGRADSEGRVCDAETLARGNMMKTIESIRKLMMICIVY